MSMINFLLSLQPEQKLYLYILKSMSIFFDHPQKQNQDPIIQFEKKKFRKNSKLIKSGASSSERKDNLNNLSMRSKKNFMNFSDDLQECLASSSFQKMRMKWDDPHYLDFRANYFTQTQRVKKQLKVCGIGGKFDNMQKNSKMRSSVFVGAPNSFSSLYRKASNKVKIAHPSYFLKIEGIVLKNKKQNDLAVKIQRRELKKSETKDLNEKSPLKNKILSKQTEAGEDEWTKGICFEKNNIVKLYNMKKRKKGPQCTIRKNSMNIDREYSYPFEDMISKNLNKMEQNEQEQFQCLKRVNTIN